MRPRSPLKRGTHLAPLKLLTLLALLSACASSSLVDEGAGEAGDYAPSAGWAHEGGAGVYAPPPAGTPARPPAQTAGDLAGALPPVGGVPTAGAPTAGEPTAGEPTAGEPNPVGGSSAAGEPAPPPVDMGPPAAPMDMSPPPPTQPPPPADEWPRCQLGALPPVDILFTPGVSGGAQALQERIAQMIRCVPSGERVRLSIYEWTHALVADAVEEAARHGVDVRVLIDGSDRTLASNQPMITRLRASLGGDRVSVCAAGCVGSGINHNKFVLISRVAQGHHHIVMQSTGNWKLHYRHNSMAVVSDNTALFDAYEAYWGDLSAQRHHPNYYDSHVLDGDAAYPTSTRVYMFPRGSGGDTVVSILDNVTGCPSGSTLRLAMGDFTDARLEVAQRLTALSGQGCSVHVMGVEDMGPQSLAVLGGWDGRRVHLYGQSDPVRVHSKYLLVDAEYNGARRQLVWMGSHNLTGPALRSNDETLLRFEHPLIWQAYMGNWDQMYRQPHANHPVGH